MSKKFESTVTISLDRLRELEKYEDAVKNSENIIWYGRSGVYISDPDSTTRELVSMITGLKDKNEELEKASFKRKRSWL